MESALADMRRRYAESSHGFIATFDHLGAQLAGAPNSDDLLTSLRRELHRVHGTAGSLGFHDASRMAGALQGLVRRWCDDPMLDRDRRSAIVERFASGLERAIAGTVDAKAPRPRRLVLLGLADAVAVRLVAEAVHRRFAVECLAEAPAGNEPEHAPVWGVVAMRGSANLLDAPYFHDTPFVLLGDASAAGSVRSGDGTALDVTTVPSAIIDQLERVAGTRGEPKGVVLIVDDDPMMQILLRTLAEHEGMTVQTAASAAQFRAVLVGLDPALVVLDVELPDGSGIDLLRGMRSEDRHREVPVLMLSGHTDSASRESAFAAGANDYMVKPVAPAEFQRRLVQLIELRHKRRVSTDLHPISGLALPHRAMHEVEARLLGRGDVEWSIVIVRPRSASQVENDARAWQAESIRLAHAARAQGGVAGLSENPGLVMGLPLAPRDTEALMTDLAESVPEDAARWHSGVVGADSLGAATPRTLVSTASDAARAARDADVAVRVWDRSDVDIAPDVIVVEDDGALSEMIAFALDAKGMTHRAYDNGPDALAALLSLRVHDRAPIVLLDIDLPGMDGHSLHERLRVERPGVFHVVFMSLHTSEADQLRALQGGALDYLSKPLSLRVLTAKLAAWRDRTRTR